MKAITAKEILQSETFFLTATMDALKIVVEAHGREFSDAVEAYKLRANSVTERVERLVQRAAEDMAFELNAIV